MTNLEESHRSMHFQDITFPLAALDVLSSGLAGTDLTVLLMDATLLPKVKVEVIVGNIPVDKVIEAAKKALYTGHIGDGKIFVYNVDKVVKVRTGEEDLDALKDVE